VNVELEDGIVREQVRARDDATGTDVLVEDGVVVRAEDGSGSDDGSDDHGGSGRGGADDGPGDDHGTDD
jgi:hypothetical protein